MDAEKSPESVVLKRRRGRLFWSALVLIGIAGVAAIVWWRPWHSKTLADKYIIGCQTGDLGPNILTLSLVSLGVGRDWLQTTKNYSLWPMSVGNSERESKFECPQTGVFGKIQKFSMTQVRPYEWTDVMTYDFGRDEEKKAFESDRSIYELLDRGKTGPLQPGQSRMLAVSSENGVGSVTTRRGSYLATYRVELERSFLNVNIVYDDSYVYSADFFQ
jgi:hypothetical protein